MYKTVLVTGASAGFGTEICRQLIKNGYQVVAVARRYSKLEQLRLELGLKLFPLEADVRDERSVTAALSLLPPAFRPIDVLINNAGLALGLDKAQEASLEQWHTMVDTNINGVLNFTHALLPSMVANNCGFIINLGSTAGSWPYKGGNVYGATKAFVAQFSRNLRTDLAGTAVKVTNIKPGLCSGTEFSSVRFHGDQAKVDATYAKVEAVTPFDIANTILWLLSLPRHLNVNDLELMPVAQTFGGLSVSRDVDLSPKS